MAITKIAQVDVGAGGSTTITFSAIPQTYTDLIIALNVRDNTGSTISTPNITINGLSATNYSWITLYTTGSTVGRNSNPTSSVDSASQVNSSGANTNLFSNWQMIFPNYAVTGNKSWGTEAVTISGAAGAGSYTNLAEGAYGASVAGITSITFAAGTGFLQYSSASLYGLSKTGATGATVA